jgi:hypothetical protein
VVAPDNGAGCPTAGRPPCQGGRGQRRLLKRGEFRSVEDSVGKVTAFIADDNRTATAFRLTYDGRPLKAS